MVSLERTSIKDTEKKNTWEPVGDQTEDLRGSTEIFSRPRGAINKNTAADCQNKPAEGTNCCWIQGCSARKFCVRAQNLCVRATRKTTLSGLKINFLHI